MADNETGRASVGRLILVPALITLGVTVARLIGELQRWSALWFNPSPGGDGALVGIVWLVPIMGIYFALKLAATGEHSSTAGRTIGLALLGIAVVACGIALAFWAGVGSVQAILIVNVAAAIAGLIQFLGWPQLARVLLVYGYAARIPVLIIMFFAIKGNWGTHYDGPPPNFSEMGWPAEFFWTGLLAQMVFWVAFTIVAGSLFGGIAIAIARKRKPVLQAAS